MLEHLTHSFDTLLFCTPDQAQSVIDALETGFDQVVALCVVDARGDQLHLVTSLCAQADRLDLPMFVDVRAAMGGIAGLDLSPFAGALGLASQVAAIRPQLGPETTIVVDAGISRHEAMMGAEAGADAVLFRNVPGQNAADIYPDDDKGPQDVAALYAWWEQLMEPPAILDLASLSSLDAQPSWLNQVEFVATQA